MKYILDSSAVIAFFDREKGGEIVHKLLLDSEHQISMHSLNVCEAFYHFWRRLGEASANDILKDLIALGVDSFDELDPSLWKKAAFLKTHYSIALGDAVGVALAIKTRSTFVTSDIKELPPLDRDRVCKFLFFR